MNRPSTSSVIDTRLLESASRFQERENGSYSNRVKILRTPDLPEGAPGSGVTAFNFTLVFRDIGAATVPLTWLLAAAEANCAPLEGVQLSYTTEGEVAAMYWFGKGWALPDGFADFIGLLATSPRIAAFEWTLDVLPHYSHLAASAIEDPSRFEQIGDQVRTALLEQKQWIIPDVLCPCAHRLSGTDDASGGRAKTAKILQRLRFGLLRWRKGGAR